MKKLSFVLFLFLLVSSFNKEEVVEKNAPSKDFISFGYSSPIVKTEYDSVDDNQIHWSTDDKITVYCNNSSLIL